MIESSDLLSPLGPIEPSMFPADTPDDLQARLAAYITDGAARSAQFTGADQNDAMTAWALWRAFDAIALRLSTTFASATNDDGTSRSYTSAQAKLMRDRANEQLATFRSFTLSEAPSGTVTPAQSGAVGIEFRF